MRITAIRHWLRLKRDITAFLGLSTIAFGFIDGLNQGASAIVRIAAGWASDRTGHPKRVAVAVAAAGIHAVPAFPDARARQGAPPSVAAETSQALPWASYVVFRNTAPGQGSEWLRPCRWRTAAAGGQ